MIYRFQSNGNLFELSLERQGNGYRAMINETQIDVEVLDSQPGKLSLMFAGHPVILYWAAEGNQKWISVEGCTYLLEKPSPQKGHKQGKQPVENVVRAPMPAQIRSIQVAEGQQVEKGQTLLLLEAMKMEIRLQAPRAGQIARLHAGEGQTVERNQILIEIKEAGGE